MTESTPPAWGTPAPSGQFQPGSVPPSSPTPFQQPSGPTPAGVPEQPAKKSSARRILGIVAVLVIVGAGVFLQFIRPAIENSRWKEGACLDTSIATMSAVVDPSIVDCGSAEAQSRIIAVVPDADLNDWESRCPGNALAALQREGETDIFCLVEN